MQKMMIAVLVLMVVASGCGPGPDYDGIAAIDGAGDAFTEEELSQDFRVPCLGRVTSDYPIYPRVFARNLRIARELLDEYGIVPAGEFCSTFEGVTVHVRHDRNFEHFGEEVTGYYDPYPWAYHIEVNRPGLVLLHEMLHHWDFVHFGVGTISHLYWGENGYNTVSTLYEVDAAPLCDATTTGEHRSCPTL